MRKAAVSIRPDAVVEAQQLCDADLRAANTRDAPQRVMPMPLQDVAPDSDGVRLTLQPASWNVICLARPAGVSAAG